MCHLLAAASKARRFPFLRVVSAPKGAHFACGHWYRLDIWFWLKSEQDMSRSISMVNKLIKSPMAKKCWHARLLRLIGATSSISLVVEFVQSLVIDRGSMATSMIMSI